jgi:hypothetical protein
MSKKPKYSKLKSKPKLSKSKLKFDGKKIRINKDYGMFTRSGNLMVHDAVQKFKKRNNGKNWRQNVDLNFKKVLHYLRNHSRAKIHPEFTDTAVTDNIWRALI